VKYKVGDKVKITTGKHSEVWCDEMKHLEGTTTTIMEKIGRFYITNEEWSIDDDDIEGLVE